MRKAGRGPSSSRWRRRYDVGMLGEPKVWLRQARRDLAAARGGVSDECHRRYWYQQSYEKAIKAYAITLVTSKDAQVLSGFRDAFLRHHAPLAVAKESGEEGIEALEDRLRRNYPKRWEEIVKTVVNVRRLTESFVDNLNHARSVRKIDSTHPSLAVSAVSYRYPFQPKGSKQSVAPADWKGWSSYQGVESTIQKALDELIDGVALQVGSYARSGSR